MDQALAEKLDHDPSNGAIGLSPEQSNTLSRTWLRLTNLFNRRCEAWGWRDTATEYPDALAAFEAGRIAVHIRRLPLDAVVTASRDKIWRHGNEGVDHARIKRAALLWMQGAGAADAKAEVRGVVGIADAYSDSANWIVECGNTRFGKLAEAITWEDTPRFTLIPFQDLERDDGTPRRLIAIDFSWSRDVTEDVENAQIERRRRAVRSLQSAVFPTPSIPPDGRSVSSVSGRG